MYIAGPDDNLYQYVSCVRGRPDLLQCEEQQNCHKTSRQAENEKQ
jgi:hypothetical protein